MTKAFATNSFIAILLENGNLFCFNDEFAECVFAASWTAFRGTKIKSLFWLHFTIYLFFCAIQSLSGIYMGKIRFSLPCIGTLGVNSVAFAVCASVGTIYYNSSFLLIRIVCTFLLCIFFIYSFFIEPSATHRERSELAHLALGRTATASSSFTIAIQTFSWSHRTHSQTLRKLSIWFASGFIKRMTQTDIVIHTHKMEAKTTQRNEKCFRFLSWSHVRHYCIWF